MTDLPSRLALPSAVSAPSVPSPREVASIATPHSTPSSQARTASAQPTATEPQTDSQTRVAPKTRRRREVELLNDAAIEAARPRRTATTAVADDETLGNKERGARRASKAKTAEAVQMEPLTPVQQLLFRVRANRYKRGVGNPSQPKRKQRGPPAEPDVDSYCFICGLPLPKGAAAINSHIDACLSRVDAQNSPSSASASLNTTQLQPESQIDYTTEEYGIVDEYTWAGQTRVRVTSMIEGGFAASGFSVHKKTDNDVEDDVMIDDDEEAIFGTAQYSQDDVRKYVIEGGEGTGVDGAGGESPIPYVELGRSTADDARQEAAAVPKVLSKFMAQVPSDAKLIIEALSQRLKDLERDQQKLKCLICFDAYIKPVVSINCWHVHCEQCWLTTIGMKRLCPQCQHITSPADLRQIYL